MSAPLRSDPSSEYPPSPDPIGQNPDLPQMAAAQPMPATLPRGYRPTVTILIVFGLVVLGLFVAGAIFLFGPDASAAGSCGGG
jgi:hypothetical protein